jgi:hypothetical protein
MMLEEELEVVPVESQAATVVDSPPPVQGISRSSTQWSMGSYPKLSRLMGRWPDVAIIRRFATLNIETLLALQAEISHLEDELKQLREEEERHNDEKGLNAQRYWFELSQPDANGEYCEQWELMQKIRVKLKEYSKFSPSLTSAIKLLVPSKL